MSKVKTDKAIALQSTDFLPASEEAMEASMIPTNSGAFLPYIEMVFPIIQDDVYDGHSWEIGFKTGSEFVPITKGTILSVLDVRKVIKRTYKDENDQTKNEYAYESITRGVDKNAATFDKTAPRYKELLSEAESRDNRFVILGNSVVCMVMFPDGKTTVADLAVFKTVHGYMMPIVAPAKFIKKAGVRIDIQNHKPNLIKAKASGHLYPSIKKFSQWEHVILEDDQCQRGIEAINNASEAYKNWLDS